MAKNYTDIIKILKELVLQQESLIDTKPRYEEISRFFQIHKEFSLNHTIDALLDSAVKTVFNVNAVLLILYTDECAFAKSLSKFRPTCRIICVTNDEKHFDYLRLLRGVSPFYQNKIRNFDKMTKK